MLLPFKLFCQNGIFADSTFYSNFTDSLKIDSTALDRILPLNALIDSAYVNSALLKSQDKQILIRELYKKSINHEWLKYINIFATTNYGVYDNLVSVQDQSFVGSTINTGNSFRWSVGITLSGAPIYDLFNKPNYNKIRTLEAEKDIDFKEDMKLRLKEMIINQYYQTKLSYDMMIVASKNVYSNFTQLVMSEDKFTDGELEIYSLANVREMYYKSMFTFLKNESDFHANYLILESICGIKF